MRKLGSIYRLKAFQTNYVVMTGMAELMLALALSSILYHYAFAPFDTNKNYTERINLPPL
ncbi:MAG: hypothetical protein HRU20_03865 [Pseudomonadales bacterium]|nr:hypothetical protein [Pseudomonadales bacterium]